MKKRYYFISYSFSNSRGTGFGSCTTFFDSDFIFSLAVENIKKLKDYKGLVILFFTEVTKKQYKDYEKLT